jgi:phospholipid/cholesterol/gamma-HCH transport system permease protein
MSQPSSPPPSTPESPRAPPSGWWQRGVDWLRVWWHIIHFGAVMLVLALSPSSYTQHSRLRIAEHIYRNTWRVLPWFTTLCALLSLVLIRIVVVTAQSYGLSNLALELVVRVLVLELLPLGSALFVVVASGLLKPRVCHDEQELAHYLPRIFGTMFSILMLAAVSSTMVLVLAYLIVYGFSPWGLPEYTHMVGHVFDPMVLLIFCLKSVLFSLAVGIIPLASGLYARGEDDLMPEGTVRLFLVLALIEAGTLAIKYI